MLVELRGNKGKWGRIGATVGRWLEGEAAGLSVGADIDERKRRGGRRVGGKKKKEE